MMKKKLITRPIHTRKEIREFFDQSAEGYREAHGPPEKLLRYRLKLIKTIADFRPTDVVLEVGCGPGQHLIHLAEKFQTGIGVDLSERMIQKAKAISQTSEFRQKLSFRVDSGESLTTVEDASIDVLICVGALEHMPDKPQVIKQFTRVLRKGGRLVILTPNGNYIWYRRISKFFRQDTRHLSTDHFVTKREIKALLSGVDFGQISLCHWTFIPRGDMWKWQVLFLQYLDYWGKIFATGSFRGGLLVGAVRK